ncbi:MAG: hypothetical protein ACRDP3_03060 [Streptomyces sp.]|uniref:hypothetical protein n=1 Tax=Streptomyces sp. TaxID=1931 RepID=UPI003D6BC100
MSGDKADLAAPAEALKLITKGITDSMGELKELGMVGEASMGRGFSDLALTGLQLGHTGLTSTLESFCERWEWGVRTLIQEGNNFAHGVGLSAGVLHEQDQYIQGSFKVLTNSAMGNPYATEEEITKKSWGEVAASNPYTHFRDADYSAESFQKAQENSTQAWKNTAWDVSTATGSPVMTAVNQGIDAAGMRDEVDAGMRENFGPSPEEQEKAAQARQQNGER